MIKYSDDKITMWPNKVYWEQLDCLYIKFPIGDEKIGACLDVNENAAIGNNVFLEFDNIDEFLGVCKAFADWGKQAEDLLKSRIKDS